MTRHTRPSLGRAGDERGAALLITLLATMLLSALGIALVLTTGTETMITHNYRASQETLYAADAGLERSIQDLLRASSWNAVLDGSVKSSFTDNANGVMPDGTPADLANLTASVQAESDATYGTNPNRPTWRLYAHSPLTNLLTAGTVGARDYVVVWVADDPAEHDGNPSVDTNGVVMIRGEAYGDGGSHKVVEATLSRTFAVPAEQGYTTQRGHNEFNQSTRAAGVGTLGQTLQQMRMDTKTGGMVVQ
jgi:Tfp pilus assembly protein PilX